MSNITLGMLLRTLTPGSNVHIIHRMGDGAYEAVADGKAMEMARGYGPVMLALGDSPVEKIMPDATYDTDGIHSGLYIQIGGKAS